jgi:hypothetical protein
MQPFAHQEIRVSRGFISASTYRLLSYELLTESTARRCESIAPQLGGFRNRVFRKASLFSSNKYAFKVSSSFLYFIIGSFSILLYFIYYRTLKISFPFTFSRNEFYRSYLAVFIIEKYLFLSNRKALWL